MIVAQPEGGGVIDQNAVNGLFQVRVVPSRQPGILQLKRFADTGGGLDPEATARDQNRGDKAAESTESEEQDPALGRVVMTTPSMMFCAVR